MNVVTLAIPASVLVSKSAHSESGADFGWVRTTRPARRRPTLLMVLVALRRFSHVSPENAGVVQQHGV